MSSFEDPEVLLKAYIVLKVLGRVQPQEAERGEREEGDPPL